jgi:uncharacterized protein
MRRSFGNGSVLDAATGDGGEHGITVIDSGCQLMFEPAVGGARKVMRFLVTP